MFLGSLTLIFHSVSVTFLLFVCKPEIMASACVNKMGMSPEKFLDCSPAAKYKSYGWLSPRMSFSREFQDGGEASKVAGAKHTSSAADKVEELDPDVSKDMVDFEFRALEDPVNMLPADELFFRWKAGAASSLNDPSGYYGAGCCFRRSKITGHTSTSDEK